MNRFICIGENIHCTRTYKVGGKLVPTLGPDQYAVVYRRDGKVCHLPVPRIFHEGAEWQAGKVKHCAVAIWQGIHGGGAERKAGVDYLTSLAVAQESAGASYLDVNVDEFTTDVDARVEAIKWTADIVQKASRLPLSIDSSNLAVFRAGLEAADRARKTPMLNSVSLERLACVDLAAEFKAAVVASAAGETSLPCTTDERLSNIERLIAKLLSVGIPKSAIYVDPLVFPISTDPGNGRSFLEAVSAVRKTYGTEIHIAAGLSNVSFGMPNRKLLNQVFAILAVDSGADGGIVDPLQINGDIIGKFDRKSEAFALAKATLMGEDEFGMNYIAACRDGRLGGDAG